MPSGRTNNGAVVPPANTREPAGLTAYLLTASSVTVSIFGEASTR